MRAKHTGYRRIWAALAAVPLFVGASVVAAPAGFATATGPAATAAGASCPDVLVIGARGSGEVADKPASGMGPTVTNFYTALADRLKAGNVRVDSVHVRYTAADALGTLMPTPAEQDRVRKARRRDLPGVLVDIASTYKAGHVDLFAASINEGLATAHAELTLQAGRCPATRFVLAGYSQGAMVMHQLLLRLSDEGNTGLLDRIADTILIADGDKKSDTGAVIYGGAGVHAEGIRSAVTIGERDVPASKASSTYDICFAGDIVCDFTPQTLTRWQKALDTHKKYEKSSVLPRVARVVAAHILAKAFVTTTSLPDGQVGVPYSATLTGTGRAPLTWSAITALPPGLTLSRRGTISGTPTAGGTSYIQVRLTDASRHTAEATIHMTINPAGGAPPPPPPPPSAGTWTATGLGLPANSHGGSLSGISCATSTACTSVGSNYVGVSSIRRMLAQTLAGGVWTMTSPPLPPDASPGDASGLSGVSCASAATCIAAGGYSDPRGGRFRPLLETLAGGVWTPTSPPVPANTLAGNAELSGVSCVSTTDCIAVGYYSDVTAGSLPLAETLAGGVWTPTALPAPAGSTSAALTEVSCVSTTACAAIGYYYAADGSTHSWAETMAAGVWTPTILPMPAGASVFYWPGGVSCASATTCVATGNYIDVNGTGFPFVETLAAGVWTPASLPLPAGASDGQVYGVSCVSATSCTATGDAGVAGVGTVPLAETLTGGVWTPTSPPVSFTGAGAGGTLRGVSCVTTIVCVAAGDDGDDANIYGRPFVVTRSP